MRKTTRKVEEESAESKDVSPSKKAKLKENKETREEAQVVVSSRLTRAAKNANIAATQSSNGENNVVAKKPRGRGKPALRRSNSSSDIVEASTTKKADSKLKVVKSQSVENLNEEAPPSKKSKAAPAKAKKTNAKKGNEEAAEVEAVPKRVRNTRGAPANNDAEPAVEEKPAKGRAAKAAVKEKAPPKEKAAPMEKAAPKEKAPAKEKAPEKEKAPAKPKAPPRKKAAAKDKAPAAEEDKVDENDTEDVPEEAVKGKKGTAAAKKPRGKKVAIDAELPEKETDLPDENSANAETESTEELKTAKPARKGKAPVGKPRGKKGAANAKQNDLEEKGTDDVPENSEEKETNGAPQEDKDVLNESSGSLEYPEVPPQKLVDTV